MSEINEEDCAVSDLSGCDVCWVDRLPTGPRLSEAHFAVRLGDSMASVYFYDEQVWNVFEVMAGPGGWAWVYIVGQWEDPSFHVTERNQTQQHIPCGCGSGRPALSFFKADGYSVSMKSGQKADA